MSPAAASASAHTTSAANGKNSSDSLLNVVDAVVPSIAARIVKKPRGCTTAIGATPLHDEWIGSLFSYFTLLLFFQISIMHIGSHSVIPVIWFSAVCVFFLFLFLYLSSTRAWHFKNLAAFLFHPKIPFVCRLLFLPSSLVFFFCLVCPCHSCFINAG